MREGKEGGISLRPKGASSQNWTTIATILASKCHHCERSSSQCFKLMLLCSFKPFFEPPNFNISTAACLIYQQLFSCKKYKNMYQIWIRKWLLFNTVKLGFKERLNKEHFGNFEPFSILSSLNRRSRVQNCSPKMPALTYLTRKF